MDKKKKLEELRKLWVNTPNPIDKKVIETRAKLLRMSMHPSELYQMEKDRELEKTARAVLVNG